jgi:DNA-binding CsgD family transcriptional regulator
MYISPTQTRQLSSLLALLSEPKEVGSLRQRLVTPIANLLNADYVASLVWDARTASFGQGVCYGDSEAHLRSYEAEYQFSDPIAPMLHKRRFPTRVTEVIPQAELVKSEFFDRFLHTGSMYWGLNIFAHDGFEDVGDLRIWRSRAKQNFDANEVEMMRMIYPSLVNALSADRRCNSDGFYEEPAVGLPMELPNGLAIRLGYQHGLSAREAQVAELVARGCSDKEIAKQLCVGYTTVRTYLTMALRKTGCVNRKALIGYCCSL